MKKEFGAVSDTHYVLNKNAHDCSSAISNLLEHSEAGGISGDQPLVIE